MKSRCHRERKQGNGDTVFKEEMSINLSSLKQAIWTIDFGIIRVWES